MSVLQSNCMRSADYLLKSPGQTWPYSLECAETHILLCLYASFIERARQISKYFFHSCCYPSVGGSIRGIYISMIPFLTVPHPHAPQNTTSERTRCRPRARETFLPIRRLLLTLAPARPTDGLRPLLLPPITLSSDSSASNSILAARNPRPLPSCSLPAPSKEQRQRQRLPPRCTASSAPRAGSGILEYGVRFFKFHHVLGPPRSKHSGWQPPSRYA